ncbi:MAG TPA: FAD-dependent oxidoreductase [Acidimicrobiales bacterium]|nr:FAD-dependent oxidoreductase [Acidimicrobiales bacterium]
MNDRYDLVVIGGGTAALVAAHGAAGVGARVALVERDRLGGDCLWTGCVPSKALIAAAATAHSMRHADRHGIDPVEPHVDLAKVMATIRAAQHVIEPHDSPERLRDAGVDVIIGHGRFTGPGTIAVDGRELRYRKALIATGSRPAVPRIDGLDTATLLTSDNVWDLTTLPRSLVVLGGGPIGCELGQAFGRLRAQVTIIEAMPHLLPREQPNVGQHLQRVLETEGVTVHTATMATRVEPAADGDGFVLSTDNAGKTARLAFDRILVSVGRRPSTTDLGLESVGVELDEHGYVIVDDHLRTTSRAIFAAGDVTGAMPFTHVAAYQARIVDTNSLFALRRKASYTNIPSVTFTDPEIARVGLDATAAHERWGDKALVQRFDYATLDRAIAHGDASGFAELIGDPKGRLVGATVVSNAAGESIAELTAWIANGAKIATISQTVHAYPTFSEGPSRAADDVLRAKYFSPRMRRIIRPVLSLLRLLDRTKNRGR